MGDRIPPSPSFGVRAPLLAEVGGGSHDRPALAGCRDYIVTDRFDVRFGRGREGFLASIGALRCTRRERAQRIGRVLWARADIHWRGWAPC